LFQRDLVSVSSMVQLSNFIAPILALASVAIATPIQKRQEPVVTYLGTQGPILCKQNALYPEVDLYADFH
jgi:hypothetical protein